MRFFRLWIFSISSPFILFVATACTGSGTGLSSIAGYCGTSACTTATAAAASIYLSSQQFTMPKALDMYGVCGGSVTTSWASTSTGTATPAVGVITCTDDRTYHGSNTDYAVAVGPYIFRQQYQLAGVCTSGGAAVNQIQVSVLHNNVPIASDLYGKAYTSYSTICDAGRFNIVLTPPSCATDATIYPSGTCAAIASTVYGQTSAALQLLVTLQTGASSTTLTTASQFATTFYVSY